MRHHYQYASLAAALMLAWGGANAQNTARTDRADGFSQSVGYATYLKGADLRASKLVGARVRNAAGDTLGEIEEIVVPTRDRDDMLVILSVGGVLDVGDKLVALPYNDLRVSPDGDTFYFDRTEEQLKAAPAFSYDGQAEVRVRTDREPERVTTVRNNDRPVTDREVNDRDIDRDRDVVDRPDRRDTDREVVDRSERRDPDRAVTDRSDRPVAERPVTDRPRTTTPSAAATAKSANVVLDVFDYRASDLIGATVLDDRGESVAKIDDIVVSTEDDKLHAVLAMGGFAGFGAKLITIPFDDLQISADGDDPKVRIAMTGEQLQALVEARPEFRYERQIAQAPGSSPRG